MQTGSGMSLSTTVQLHRMIATVTSVPCKSYVTRATRS